MKFIKISSLVLLLNPLSTCAQNNLPSSLLTESKEVALIVGGSIAAAVLYGIAQDQITARICPEYFTQGFHKNMKEQWNGPILSRCKTILDKNPDSPTIQAVVWGTVASWWVGASLGIPLALAARLGNNSQINAYDLIKPMAVVIAATAVGALAGGIHGHFKFKKKSDEEITNLMNPAAVEGVSQNQYRPFLTDAYAHEAAYKYGAFAGLGLIGYTIYQRLR